jgi:hypothetical protein
MSFRCTQNNIYRYPISCLGLYVKPEIAEKHTKTNAKRGVRGNIGGHYWSFGDTSRRLYSL